MTRAAVRERAQARRAADAAFREAFDAYMFECFAKPGFKLESEAQLAERFGVTRYKVRKAIEALNQAGVLERVKHGGSTVRSVTPEELADLTIQFYRRNYIEGLFLSSGIVQSAVF